MTTKSQRKRRRRREKRKQRKAVKRQQRLTARQANFVDNLFDSDGMRLVIEPSDTWLFRDGKPFRAGEDHWAGSRFPPTPLTIQGVIRSKILLDSDTDLRAYAENPSETAIYAQIGGKGRDYGALKIRGPYLAHKKNAEWTRYYPAPADLLCDQEYGKIYRLTVGESPIIANWPHPSENLRPLYPPNLQDQASNLTPAGGWIAEESLRAYLEGRLPEPEHIVPPGEIYEREPRIIIGLERQTRRPRPQLLAGVEMVRLRPDWALDLEISGVPPWKSQGYLGIGGEARAGYYQVRPPTLSFASPEPLPSRFVLYFATPTWFQNGWRPENWGKWFSGKISLVAAAINRPERIGGWDIVKGEKPMRGYVPAGSIYYFESEGEVSYNGEPVTDDPAEGQIGFGQVFIGQWPQNN